MQGLGLGVSIQVGDGPMVEVVPPPDDPKEVDVTEVAHAPRAEEDAIFDAKQYELPIPKLDGHRSDKLTVSFGGSVELDRTDEESLALLERLRLGQDVTMTVEATVAGKGFSHTTKADEEEQVGYQVRLRVHSIEGDTEEA